MPIIKIEKKEILRRCWTVLHRHGYHATSIGMLAEETGLGKSGLMHHFSSKENLMHEVIQFAVDELREYVFNVATEDLPAEQRIEKFLRRQNRLAKIEHRGCFFANTVLETGCDGTFNRAIQEAFEEWQEIMATIFSEYFSEEESAELAYRLLLEYEGAVAMYKLTGDEMHLEKLVARAVRTFGKEMRGGSKN